MRAAGNVSRQHRLCGDLSQAFMSIDALYGQYFGKSFAEDVSRERRLAADGTIRTSCVDVRGACTNKRGTNNLLCNDWKNTE